MSTSDVSKIAVVAEDEPAFAAVIEGILTKRLGYRVVMVDSKKDAVKKLEELRDAKTPADLLITDYGLTDGKTGIDLIIAARQLQPALPAIMVTGSELDVLHKAMGEKGLAPSSFMLLAKPVKLKALMDAVENSTRAVGNNETEAKPASAATALDRFGGRTERKWEL